MAPTEAIVMIASICYEANRRYCETMGDHSFKPWDEAPEWQKSTNAKGVTFHLTGLMAGNEPSPAASHDSWLEEKTREGWSYGPVKDAEAKTHPCFLPYEQLPAEQRQKDYIFGAIVKSFYDSGILLK